MQAGGGVGFKHDRAGGGRDAVRERGRAGKVRDIGDPGAAGLLGADYVSKGKPDPYRGVPLTSDALVEYLREFWKLDVTNPEKSLLFSPASELS